MEHRQDGALHGEHTHARHDLGESNLRTERKRERYQTTVLYLLMVYYGPKMMEKRKAFDLRSLLAVWNMSLAVYSGLSLYFIFPLVVKAVYNTGLIGEFLECQTARRANVCRNSLHERRLLHESRVWLRHMALHNEQGPGAARHALPHSAQATRHLHALVSLSQSTVPSRILRDTLSLCRYHHALTFAAGNLYFTELVPWARWGVLINSGVHTVMYL